MQATDTFTTANGRVVVDGVEQPHPIDLVRELRRVVGLFDGAMAKTPQEAWEEALRRVADLVLRAGDPETCRVDGGRCHCRPDLPTYHETAQAG